MTVLIARSTIIGIIVGIVIAAITIAVCFYLLSLKGKAGSDEE